jgi:glutathione synthase
MRIGFLVNAVDDVLPNQTTALLIAGAAARGHETFLLGVGDLTWSTADTVAGRSRRVRAGLASLAEAMRDFRAAQAETLKLASLDILMFRTNPARDPARQGEHLAALAFGRLLRDAGVFVCNDPDGLACSATKLYLQAMPPAVRPRAVISADRDELTSFLDETAGPIVVKPLRGTRGSNVLLVIPEGVFPPQNLGPVASLDEALDRMPTSGQVLAQEYLPEAASGHVRLVLLDGEPLTAGGVPAAIRRVPKPGEFRSNAHFGGTAQPAQLDEGMRLAASLVGPRLVADGILLAGLDLIGGKAVEINTYSTGGLGPAMELTGKDFIGAVLDWLESQVASTGELRDDQKVRGGVIP